MFLTPRLAESRVLGLLDPRTGNSCGDRVIERLTFIGRGYKESPEVKGLGSLEELGK